MGIIEFLNSGWFTLLFYMTIGALVYYNREKFEFQGRFVALYRTKLGIRWMKSIAGKFPRTVRALGYTGIVLGYLGMVAIVVLLFKGIFDFFFVPAAPPVVAPIIPGVSIPGSPITPPLIAGIVSLFLVIVIHEFSHGVVAKAHKIPIKSSGFGMLGPIPIAFVEPDEKKLEKRKGRIQNSMFAAGPFSNMLTGLLVALVSIFLIVPAISSFLNPVGVTFTFDEGLPAANSTLEEGVVYTQVNDIDVATTSDLMVALENITPNDTVFIGNSEGVHEVVAAAHPQNKSKGYLGVYPSTKFKHDSPVILALIGFLISVIDWFIIFSFGLGLANLLPIGPVDGGRMYQVACRRFFGKEKGDLILSKTSVIMLFVILLAFLPIIKAILEKLLGILSSIVIFLL